MAIFGNTLYYPGCMSKIKLKHIAENYKTILDRLGIKYITIKDIELCCGIPALNAGYREDFYDIMDRNKEIFENQKVSKIITNCPSCARVFSKEYGIKTEHITQTIAKNLDKLKKKHDGEDIAYHDPCNLGRKFLVYDEPRAILRHVGFEIIEFRNNKENSSCCGAGGLLKANSPKISGKVAMSRLKEVRTKKLVTTCPLCYLHLKENARGIEVLELSEVLV